MNATSIPSNTTLIASGFFVMRSPLLPASALAHWSDALTARAAFINNTNTLEQAVAFDRTRLETRLRTLIENPVIDQAIEVASTSLHASARAWRLDPTHPRGCSAITALARYFCRMSSRCTPFGLFAGNSIGAIGATTQLHLSSSGEYRTHTRIDAEHLAQLGDSLAADSAIRATLCYETNSSLYQVADQLRYTKSVPRQDGGRTYQLVSIQATPTLQHVLERGAMGATLHDLAESLCMLHGDPTLREQALQFVNHLVGIQLLQSPFEPSITGKIAATQFLDVLHATGHANHQVAVQLTKAQAELHKLDQSALGSHSQPYRAAHEALHTMTPAANSRRALQVDLIKPAPQAVLSQRIADELANAVQHMHRLCPPAPRQDLKAFRDAFRARYQDREIPLAEALDEDFGIGFDVAPVTQSSASSLLTDLSLTGGGARKVTWDNRQAHLLKLLCNAYSAGSQILALSPTDIDALSSTTAPLPDALAVNVTLIGTPDDIARDNYRIQWHGAFGPSGALYFGRFCQGIPELEGNVRQHIQSEEMLRPDAIFAEIVHLPQIRNGNIMCRPQLRTFEIPFLGRSGAPLEQRITLADLMVSVVGQRIVLRSKRLNREVIPRLTTAHNAPYAELSLYRFLTALQVQDVANWLAWDWGVLRDAPFLPRVTVGKLILAPSRWRLSDTELHDLQSRADVARFQAAQQLRERLHLPRWIGIKEDDRLMPIDLDNVISIEILAQQARGQSFVDVVELITPPGDEQLCATSEDGAFMHELVVPYIAKTSRAAEPSALGLAESTKPTSTIQRLFVPGDEWLYAKIYTSPSLADRVLKQFALPIVASARTANMCSQWFYIRYADPDPHLRVRLRVPDPTHRQAVQARLLEALSSATALGLVHKIQIDTYDREVERYGGPMAIEIVEQLFHNDSTCAESLLATTWANDENGKWQLAIVSIDQLLNDLGIDLTARCTLLDRLAHNLRTEFGAPATLAHQLGNRYRALQSRLNSILAPRVDAADGLGSSAWDAFALRSKCNAEPVGRLHALNAEGQLSVPVTALAPHLIHMSVNRLLQSAMRAQELVMYALLSRYYRGQIARGGQRSEQGNIHCETPNVAAMSHV